MATTMRRAVITGLGVISPIGSDLASFQQSLRERRSGIRRISHMDVSELPCQIAADIPNFDAKKYIIEKTQRKSLKMMARTVQIGVSVVEQLVQTWGIRQANIDPARIGVEFGSAMIHTELEDIGHAAKVSTNCQPGFVDMAIWGKTGMKEIPPLWMLKYLPNMPACHATINHQFRGPSNTITSGDVSSLLALGEAWRILNRDEAEAMMVGGCESKLNPLNFVRQSLFQPLSRCNQTPEQSVKPFDKRRDGTVLAEAGVAFGLETLESAQKRQAKIYAELVGFASGFDRSKSGIIVQKTIARALAMAAIKPDQVDHINAHGLGTADGDRWEAHAIAGIFGRAVPVVALKGYFGAAGPAGSLLELLASLLAFQTGVLPSTLNHEVPDADCPISVLTETSMPVQKSYVVKLSFTEMGHVAVAILKKWE